MWEVVVICIMFSISNLASLFLGLHYGSKSKEEIKLPTVNPVKIVKNNIEERKAEKKRNEEERIDEINSFNIDNYDGTGLGQREFPR